MVHYNGSSYLDWMVTDSDLTLCLVSQFVIRKKKLGLCPQK